MKRKHRKFVGEFKAEVGFQALTGIKVTAQIAREHQIKGR